METVELQSPASGVAWDLPQTPPSRASHLSWIQTAALGRFGLGNVSGVDLLQLISCRLTSLQSLQLISHRHGPGFDSQGLAALFLLNSKSFSSLFVPQAGPWCRICPQLSLENSWHIWRQGVAPESNLLGPGHPHPEVLRFTAKHWARWGHWAPG